jgi:hypothetical protein
MVRFQDFVAIVFLTQAVTANAGDPGDLIFGTSFEGCVNFVAPVDAVEWDGGGDKVSWADPLNWEGDVLPANDSSVALGPNRARTIIYDNSLGTTRLTNLNSCTPLRITGGTLEIEGAAEIQCALELTGGTLRVNGTLVADTLQHINGNVRGTGTVTVTAGYIWAGGTTEDAGETIVNGIHITNTIHTLRGRTLTINGSSSWTGGNVHLWSGSTIDNNSTFDIQTDADMVYLSGANTTFINDSVNGTVTKTATGDGDGITKIGANFDNDGTISVISGELQMGRPTVGETSTGSFEVMSGSIFGVTGNHDMTAASFTGGGGFRMVAGNGTTTIGTYMLAGPLIGGHQRHPGVQRGHHG